MDHPTIIDSVIEHTCANKCFGRRGYAAGCCRLEGRDFIPGPVRDAAAVVERLSRRFRRALDYRELFIDHVEGSALFPDRPAWQHPESFPALRPRLDAGAGFPCQFLGNDNRCTIYEDRPEMCRSYRCDHLNTVIELLT